MLDGFTRRFKTTEGKFYITVNHTEDGKPFEIFSTPNAQGKQAAVNAEALCRLVSLALRHGVDVKFIYDQLVKVRNQDMLSLPGNIARALAEYLEDNDEKHLRVKN